MILTYHDVIMYAVKRGKQHPISKAKPEFRLTFGKERQRNGT